MCTACFGLYLRPHPQAYQYKNLRNEDMIKFTFPFVYCEPGTSVGIATELRAGRSGIESRWGRDFPPVQTGPGALPASCKMCTVSLPGVKCGRGVLLTTHPLVVPRSWKSRVISLPTLWATLDLWRERFYPLFTVTMFYNVKQNIIYRNKDTNN